MTMRKVVKLGGSVWDTLHPGYLSEWKTFIGEGNELVIVHGGGPRLSAYCEAEQMSPLFQNGRRVTTEAVLVGAMRILAGEVQTEIVSSLGRFGMAAIGLSGVDGNQLIGRHLAEYGAVGTVDEVDDTLLQLLLANGYVPVMTSLLAYDQGVLNCNGDDCAVALAQALEADCLEVITDVPGIRINGRFQEVVTPTEMAYALETGEIHGGMIPKTEALNNALAAGIDVVHLRYGADPTAAGTIMKKESNAYAIADIRTTNA